MTTPDSDRLPTGVAGLDDITHGGLFPGGVYVVVGRPGAGKSIFGNQLAHTHARRGGNVVYVTLLAETHARLLAQVRKFEFFEESLVGSRITYLNAMSALESEGLEGLLRSMREMVRAQDADLLVMDGLVPNKQMGIDALAYRKFLALLQSWIGVVGCTAVILKSSNFERRMTAEQTMVDGILELHTERHGMRTLRELEFTKLRGSAFAEGRHAYSISQNGLEVFPRLETITPVDERKRQPLDQVVPSGTPGFDAIVGGALVRGSTTLVLGSSGSGKSISCLQFLADGARAGERVLYFGFYEPPHAIIAKGDRLGLDLSALVEQGLFQVSWRSPAQPTLDQLAHDLLALVRSNNIARLAIDGFAALRTSDHPDRIAAVFSVLTNELSRSGITTIVTDETRELFVHQVQVETQFVSALFHNIVFFRQVEIDAQLRRLVGVMKTRDSGHDQHLWEVVIDDHGLRVIGPFEARERGLIRGNGKGSDAGAGAASS